MVWGMDDADRDRLRALLEATHCFPGPFYLSVITASSPDVHAALRHAIEEYTEWETRSSSGGRYTSHRVTIPCRSADDALLLYTRVAAIAGVVTVL